MATQDAFVDIHCHIISRLDDGADSIQDSLAMATMASGDGIGTIIATPHQLGTYHQNTGDQIREATRLLQTALVDEGIPLRLLPGADVRIEPDLVSRIQRGDVLTLGDHGKHVLLELPHDMYFHLDPILSELRDAGIQGILSHPERNQGILSRPDIVRRLVDCGCLMQITAGSLMGTFGSSCQRLAQHMLTGGLVHFVATDAHGQKSRRPRLSQAYKFTTSVMGQDIAKRLFCTNPKNVALGRFVANGVRRQAWSLRRWFGRVASA